MLRDETCVDAGKTNSRKETCRAARELFKACFRARMRLKYCLQSERMDGNSAIMINRMRCQEFIFFAAFNPSFGAMQSAVFEILYDINANKICRYRPHNTRI